MANLTIEEAAKLLEGITYPPVKTKEDLELCLKLDPIYKSIEMAIKALKAFDKIKENIVKSEDKLDTYRSDYDAIYGLELAYDIVDEVAGMVEKNQKWFEEDELMYDEEEEPFST